MTSRNLGNILYYPAASPFFKLATFFIPCSPMSVLYLVAYPHSLDFCGVLPLLFHFLRHVLLKTKTQDAAFLTSDLPVT